MFIKKDVTMYKIAIVIPTLNEEKFIAQCLDCVIRQTFPFTAIDLMVVDGGSNDRTKSIVEKYQKRYSNIRLFIIQDVFSLLHLI